jgi:hypothetical protein
MGLLASIGTALPMTGAARAETSFGPAYFDPDNDHVAKNRVRAAIGILMMAAPWAAIGGSTSGRRRATSRLWATSRVQLIRSSNAKRHARGF